MWSHGQRVHIVPVEALKIPNFRNMKRAASLFLFCFGLSALGQSIIGAWERVETTGTDDVKYVMIFAENYVITSATDAKSGGFISTRFEQWSKPTPDSLKVILEFDSDYPEAAGGDYTAPIRLGKNQLELDGVTWKKVSESKGSELSGIWTVVARRSMEGVMEQRNLKHPLKRYKLLSATRFHWLEYDEEARIFSGTGGGTYIVDGDEYVEFIEFYANDPGYVGDSVRFKMKVEGEKWFHQGLLGEDDIEEVIDEIWIVIH